MITLKTNWRLIATCWVAALALGSAPVDIRKASASERIVLMEKYSASWCPHCATASQAIDILVDDHSDKFITFDAFAASNNGGRYSTDWGQQRAFVYYALGSYPTTWFDGKIGYEGAPSVNAVYSAYLGAIESLSSVASDVVIDVSAVPTGTGVYDVTMTVSLEPGGFGKTLRLHLLQALDDYGVYDDQTTVAHNTVMQSLEDGYDVMLVPGQTMRFTETLTLDAASASQFEDIRLIAWAQEPAPFGYDGGAEVFNAAQVSLSNSHPADFNSDGIVNAGDLSLWQNEFGSSGLLPGEGADGDRNGRVDGADFLLWQQNVGLTSNQPSSVAAAATPIPEPGSLLLALTGVALGVGLRCSQPV
jgi:hypothetical protein